MRRVILLSFDVEEFDIPLEYGDAVSAETQIQVSADGLELLLELLSRLNIQATFFTTAAFALQRPELIRRVAQDHEIASHGYSHTGFEMGDLLRSRLVLEEITGSPIVGIRRARLEITPEEALRAAGYLYDSSVNPIFLPGRYNNLSLPRTAWENEGLLQIPISATPWLRLPLFWLSFKNLPAAWMRAASLLTLYHDAYLNLFFHTWEFCDLKPYRLPWYVRRMDGGRLLLRLERYLNWLQAQADFVSLSEFRTMFLTTSVATPEIRLESMPS